MSPLLKSVEKAGKIGIEKKRNPFTLTPNDFFSGSSEPLRDEFAKLINVKNPRRIVIIPSVSYGMATVAKNVRLKSGDKIIVASEQFPSNYYPWQRIAIDTGSKLIAIAPPDELENRGKNWNEHILEAINHQQSL